MLKFYLHTPELPGWDNVFAEMVSKMAASGLFDALDELHICLNGQYDSMKTILDPLQELSSKIKVRTVNDNAAKWEWPTINTIYTDYQDSSAEDYVGYAHLKGLSRRNPNDTRARDWRHYLSYYTIERWADNIRFMDQGYDTVGVNWMENPWPHYSGNFWWAKSSHIRNLPQLEDPSQMLEPYNSRLCYSRVLMRDEFRLECEAWIGAGGPNTKRCEIHRSPGNPNFMFHYHNNYPPHLYREDQ